MVKRFITGKTPEKSGAYNPQRTVAQMREADKHPRDTRRAGGRPPLDPEDLKTERYGFRMHPDLRAEIEYLARMDGVKMSAWIERALIERVNARGDGNKLDNIGRYTSSKRVKR